MSDSNYPGPHMAVNARDEGPRKLVLTMGGREVPLHELADEPQSSSVAVAERTPAAEADAPMPPAPPTACAVTDAPRQTYFVIQRANGHWSVAAKIIGVFSDEPLAEAAALVAKEQHPQQHFGVAVLVAEAMPVAHPIQIVRAVP